MLRTHERLAVATRGGGSVYGSSAAPQQSTEVKPAESASHAERLSDPLLSSRHGLESVAEQLHSRRSTAATITRQAPSMQTSLITAAAGGRRETPTYVPDAELALGVLFSGRSPSPCSDSPVVTHTLDKLRRSAPGAPRRAAEPPLFLDR